MPQEVAQQQARLDLAHITPSIDRDGNLVAVVGHRG
jgi:hypothetical protein